MKLSDLIKKLSDRPSLRQSILIWKGSRMFLQAVAKAEELHREAGYRYYVIWDPALRRLIAVTYELHHKEGSYRNYCRQHKYASYLNYISTARADSYKALVWRGRFRNRLTVEQFRELSFYFTASRGGAPSCSEEQLSASKCEWLRYYLSLNRKLDNIRPIPRHFSLRRLCKQISLYLRDELEKFKKLFY